jgi:hypothetical protein
MYVIIALQVCYYILSPVGIGVMIYGFKQAVSIERYSFFYWFSFIYIAFCTVLYFILLCSLLEHLFGDRCIQMSSFLDGKVIVKCNGHYN